jgi:16S rRNA (uracil1498-N3)-methyltransferase
MAGKYNATIGAFQHRVFLRTSHVIWLFVSPAQIRDGLLTIEGPKGHHLARVRRVRPGEAGVAVVDGLEHGFTVVSVEGSTVRARLSESRPNRTELGYELVLLQAVLPSADFDAVLEGGTEVGVTRFVPVVAARSVARPKPDRRERWRAVVESAAEQSHRGRIPEVTAPMTLAEALRSIAGTPLVILDPSAPQRLGPMDGPVAVAVGPEGGWTSDELAAMVEAGGTRVTLGPRILRARLAPVAAAVILSAR